MSAARLRLVECRAILGGERDEFRAVWDEQATVKDRRLLLALGRCNAAETARLFGRAWLDLPVEIRGDVKAGLKRFTGWAERLK